MIPVILSGGLGTRLWPSSRSLFPKQYFSFIGDKTMLQSTCLRMKGSIADTPPMVLCNSSHQHMVSEQLTSIGLQSSKIILEPVARNTAPAIALSALSAISDGSDPILLILPVDHFITNTEVFHQSLNVAKRAADKGDMVTLGITPDQPSTNFGYIKTQTNSRVVQPIEEFVDRSNAFRDEELSTSKNCYWNSGIYIFKASTYLAEMKKLCPEILMACEQSFIASRQHDNFIDIDTDSFSACQTASISSVILKKTEKAVVVPMDAGWSDVGNWSSLWDMSSKDLKGNVVRGDVVAIDSSNNFIQNDKKLITLIGVDDLVVVESDDAILISDKSKVQDVKSLVGQLKNDQRKETELHRKVHRPWGCYDSLAMGGRFQVKQITVKENQKLSLQKHHHRAEHWIVVKGTALVTLGSEKMLLTENQSTYIPVGVEHRLENPGNIPLEIIEIQSGSYLGEDDIVRIEDTYGRV